LTVTISPPPGIWTFGRNDAGALGLNDRVYRSSPTQVGAGTNWSQISKGQRSTIATKTDGTLWAWGFNSQGQCAQNDAFTNSRSSPTQVGVATNWSLVSAGSYHLAAIKTDGTLWVWGINNQGQLGLNDTANRSSPTQVGVATNWSKINGGAFITFAGKTDGTLWAWGHNQFGRLGLNDTNSRSSPVQVGVATNWSRFEVDSYHTAATKTDGTLWLWGSNGYGQFGNNSRFDYRSSPVQLGATTNWSQIDVGQYQTTATKTDGTLWVWGRNTQGTLGLNDTASRSSPTQSGTGTNWSMISTSVYNNLATKTDGTLWSWGRNTNGQLGQNDTASRSSPTQIGTATNWTLVSVGSYSSMARTT
jgi:alpha-tubulin suppressor-like RCC1 family protein